MKIKKIILPGILAGILMGLIGMGIGVLFNWLYPSLVTEYANTAIFRAMEDPLMMLFWLYPLILGIVLAWVWDKTKKLFKSKAPCARGAKFGLVYFFVATIPGMLISYSSFQISLLITLTWTLNGLLNGIFSGMIFARLNK